MRVLRAGRVRICCRLDPHPFPGHPNLLVRRIAHTLTTHKLLPREDSSLFFPASSNPDPLEDGE